MRCSGGRSSGRPPGRHTGGRRAPGPPSPAAPVVGLFASSPTRFSWAYLPPGSPFWGGESGAIEAGALDGRCRPCSLGAPSREVFEFRPELVNDDDEEADDTRYIQGTGGDEVDDSVGVNDIDLSLYVPRDVEETGITVASLERFSTYASDKDENKLSEASGGLAENGERSDLDEDSGGGGQENGSIDAVPVDENLFTGEDLDELEEELNTLDLEE